MYCKYGCCLGGRDGWIIKEGRIENGRICEGKGKRLSKLEWEQPNKSDNSIFLCSEKGNF